MKANYHGIDKDGKRVTSVDPSDIECGLDAQSFTAMWMQNTLTGSAKGTYNTLQSEITKNNSLCNCGSAPEGYQRRLSPTAYSVHKAIKELAKPDDCIKKLTRDMNEFHSAAKNLPANATATQAHKWLNDRTTERNELILSGARQRSTAHQDEFMFLSQLLSKSNHR